MPNETKYTLSNALEGRMRRHFFLLLLLLCFCPVTNFALVRERLKGCYCV